MATIKPTKERLNALKARLDGLQQHRATFQKLADGSKTDFWKTLKERFRHKYEGALSKLRSRRDKKLPHDEIISLLQEEEDWYYCMTLADDFAHDLKILDKDISELNLQIGDYERKLRKSGLN